MQKITVTTGFGYYVDEAGHKIAKAQLPIGKHRLADDLIYIEVANKDALDAIDLYIDPAVLQKQEDERKIADKIRQTAIDTLIAEGQLPTDYKD